MLHSRSSLSVTPLILVIKDRVYNYGYFKDLSRRGLSDFNFLSVQMKNCSKTAIKFPVACMAIGVYKDLVCCFA